MAELRSFLLRVLPDRLTRNPIFNRLIRNAGYLFTGTTLSAALSMVQSVLAARILGVEGFGLLGIITVYASVINRLTSFRMGELVVSEVGVYSERQQPRHAAAAFKAAIMAEMMMALLAYLLIVILAPLGARFLAQDPGRRDLFMLYGLIVVANLISESASGLLQYFDRFRILAAIAVGQSLLTLGLIAGLFVLGGNLEGVVSAYLLGKVVWALAITVAALRLAGRQWGRDWWRAPVGLLRPRWPEMSRFAISTNLTGTLTLLTRDSEVLWLGALSGPLQAGYYKTTLAITNILLMPVQPLVSTTYRELAREVAAGRWKNVRYLLRSGSLLAGAYSLAAGLGLILAGRWVVGLWGPQYLPTSYQALLVLLLGVTVINSVYWNRTALLPMGQPEFPTKVTLVFAVLKIAAILVIVPRAGALGMAATLSFFFLGTSLTLVWRTLHAIRTAERSSVRSPSGSV